MWRLSLFVGCAIFFAIDSASYASPLYLTTKAPRGDNPFGTSSDGYVFVAPYYIDVRTQLILTISTVAGRSDNQTRERTLNADVAVKPVPVTRGYLYLRQDAFFSDTVNVTVNTEGLLSSSETASVQQFTAILNQILESIPTGPMKTLNFFQPQDDRKLEDRDKLDNDVTNRELCNKGILAILTEAPSLYFRTPAKDSFRKTGEEFPVETRIATLKNGSNKEARYLLRVTPFSGSLGKASLVPVRPARTAKASSQCI